MNKGIYQQTAEVYNRLGKKYLDDSKKIIVPARLPFTKSFAKNSLILDVGCGGGRDSKFFVKNGLQVIGIDVSSVLINEAKKEVPDAVFSCEDILKSKFPNNYFDGIWAQAVLLHLKRADVPKAINKFYKILKPGGLVHIQVRKGKGEGFVKDILSGENARFYTYFSKIEIEKILKDSGFLITYSDILSDDLGRKGISWISIGGKKKFN
ncbi:MAG: class I SAM-dependent methyltransferase [Patescibacteria group bacterium]